MAIRDHEFFRRFEEEVKALRARASFWQCVFPFSRKGREVAKFVREDLPRMEEQVEELRSVPDRFNHLFRQYGWIASEYMNFEAMKRAVQIAEDEGIDEAEQFLEDHWNSNENIEFWLRRLCFNPLVSKRYKLLSLALKDHNAERFHASVPVVLAQIDGIVFDLTKKSFFERGRKRTKHLRAKESVVADPSGLAALADGLSDPRSATDQGPVSLAYRHGIFHGEDLGYANRRTSTKAFAALLSLAPWVEKTQGGGQPSS